MRPAVSAGDVDDPRLGPLTDLADPERRRRIERLTGLIVLEGRFVLDAALAGGVEPSVVAVIPSLVDEVVAVLAAAASESAVEVVVIEPAALQAVAGFRFHRGVLALAARPGATSVAEIAERAGPVLCLEGVNDHENVGSLFRSAAALGVGGVLLCPSTADPHYRRSIRVSMGLVFRVTWARSDDWPGDLARLDRPVVALSPAARTTIAEWAAGTDGRVAVLVGAEGPGLTAAAMAAATVTVRIPMAPEVDSLNVGVAAAIALSHLPPSGGRR